MFFIIGIALGLLLVSCAIYKFIRARGCAETGAEICLNCGITIFLIPLMIAMFASQLCTLHENSILLVMEQNIEAYRQTVVQMNDVAAVYGNGSAGLLQNIGQSSRTSSCLKEYRDMVVEYNKAISYRKLVQDNFWLGIFVVRLPPGIEIIEFYLKQEYR